MGDVVTLQAVQNFTEEVFSTAATVALARDPESGGRIVIVSVPCHGTVEELVAKSDRWHRGIESVARDMTPLCCLSIIPLDDFE